MKVFYFCFLLLIFNFSLIAKEKKLMPPPGIAFANNGTQVAVANVERGTTTHILHQLSLTITNADATLTGAQCVTAGTYIAGDVTNLKVRYSADATLDAGDATLSTYTNPGVAGTKTFPTFTSQTINTGTSGYLFITVDLAAGATVANTINVNAVTQAHLTFSSGNKSGSTTAGGVQTITFTPSSQATVFTSSLITSNSMTIGWTRGNGNAVLVIAKETSAPSDPTIGINYTGGGAYRYGTSVGGGYAVYNGTATSVNLTALSGNTTYYFAVYEYNTAGYCYNLIELTGNAVTSTTAQQTLCYTYGGTGSDVAYYAIETADGGYMLVGTTSSFGAGSSDASVMKTADDGTLQFSKTYGGATADEWDMVKQISGNGGYILAGASDGGGDYDGYVARIDNEGALTWARRPFGGGGFQVFEDVAEVSDGFVFAGQNSTGTASLTDTWLYKTDFNGALTWTRTHGSANAEHSCSFSAVSTSGFINVGLYNAANVAGGILLNRANSLGVNRWDKYYTFGANRTVSNVIETSDKGFLIVGSQSDYGAGGYDVVLIKTDSSGVTSWIKAYGGTGTDIANSIAQTSDGGYVFSGYTTSSGAGSNDGLLVKINSTGTIQWSYTYGGAASDYFNSLQINSFGGFVMGGANASTGAGGNDMWLVVTDGNGVNTSQTAATLTTTTLTGLITETSSYGADLVNGTSATPVPTVGNQLLTTTKTIQCPRAPLPIELINFTTDCETGKVQIKWATATETNNDFFTIERTTDGINNPKNFIIDSKAIGGTSSDNIQYAFTDEEPENGFSYYRLKQTDFDGKSTYFQIVPTQCNANDNTFDFTVFPNPNNGQEMNITILGETSKEVLIVVEDIFGREKYTKMLLSNGNQNYFIPLNNLSSGIYYVKASSNNKMLSKKIVVQ